MSAVQPRPQAQMLTPQDIGGLLGLSPMTVYRFIHSGQLPAHRLGRSFRVRRDDFEEFMRSTLVTRGDAQ